MVVVVGDDTLAPEFLVPTDIGLDGVLQVVIISQEATEEEKQVQIDDASSQRGGTAALLYTGKHILHCKHAIEGTDWGGTTPEDAKYWYIFAEGPDGKVSLEVEKVEAYRSNGELIFGGSDKYDFSIITLKEEAPPWVDRYDIYRGTDEIGKTYLRVGYGMEGLGEYGRGTGFLPQEYWSSEDEGGALVKRYGSNTYDMTEAEFLQKDANLWDTEGLGSIADYQTALKSDFDDGTAANDAFAQGNNNLNDIEEMKNVPHVGVGKWEVGSSPGNSGGPNFVDGRIAGIGSGGGADHPNGQLIDGTDDRQDGYGWHMVDSRVSSVVDWIEGIVGKNDNTTLITLPGTMVDDILTTTGGPNKFYGYTGNDTITGGTGSDIAGYRDVYANYEISKDSLDVVTVKHKTFTTSTIDDGTDTLTNIETLKFTDQTILASSITSEQTYLVSGQSIEIIEGSGTSYIDSLFNNAFGSPIKWVSDPYLNAEYSVNGSTVITYSFPGLLGTTALFNYTDDRGEIVAVPFSAEQAADTRLALAKISEYINVTFVEVEEVGDAVGTIRFGINTITDEEGNYREGIAATGDPPGPDPRGGDVWFNKWFTNVADFSAGLVQYGEGDSIGSVTGDGDVTVLYHEIFHTLGIEHPGDHPTIPFPEGKNSREYSVMAGEFNNTLPTAHIDGVNYVVSSTPMVYDIAAIQYLYGANMTHNSGDTTYSFDPDTPFIEAIWDAGGNDTLDFSNFSKSNTISLVDGEHSTIGFDAKTNEDVYWTMTDNLGIAFNAIIENAIGGSGADTITGNSSANNIQGGAGNDIIDGGSGIDTAIFKDSSTSYTITTNTNGSISVVHSPASDSVTNEGTDSLANVEYMQFTDKTVASTSLKYSLSASVNSSVNILEAHSESAISGTLNFNAGNNVIILDGQATTYRGLEGDDTYFVSQLLPKNSKISITDTSGDNTIQLPANTYIDTSLFTKNAARLTLEDGREVTISGADKFTYNVGGNITNGTDGIDLTFREFADVFGVYDILNTSGAQTGTISDMYII